MFATTWRPAAALLLAASVAGAGAVPDDKLAARVDERVKAWQPTKEERRFDEIGWCHSILEAQRLAKEHNRPIFWFTHDGKMSVGRC